MHIFPISLKSLMRDEDYLRNLSIISPSPSRSLLKR